MSRAVASPTESLAVIRSKQSRIRLGLQSKQKNTNNSGTGPHPEQLRKDSEAPGKGLMDLWPTSGGLGEAHHNLGEGHYGLLVPSRL